MAPPPRPRRLRGRRLLTLAGSLLGTATIAALLAGGGPAGAATAPSAATYAALASTAPPGLRIVPGGGPAPGSPAGVPELPAQPPSGSGAWPVAGTVRRVALGAPGLSGWIARSSEGGVCVLLYDGVPVRGVAALYVGCGPLATGAEIEVSEIPGLPGETIAAGVVPDGVTSVSRPAAGGATATAPVEDGAWASVTGAGPAGQTGEEAGR